MFCCRSAWICPPPRIDPVSEPCPGCSASHRSRLSSEQTHNNVFKDITLRLMASVGAGLGHLAREWSGRSVPSTASFEMMSSVDYVHWDSIWKCIHIYLVYLHCICIDQWRVKVKWSKLNERIQGGCPESAAGVSPMPFMMSL